jgi:hypothetical protein
MGYETEFSSFLENTMIAFDHNTKIKAFLKNLMFYIHQAYILFIELILSRIPHGNKKNKFANVLIKLVEENSMFGSHIERTSEGGIPPPPSFIAGSNINA